MQYQTTQIDYRRERPRSRRSPCVPGTPPGLVALGDPRKGRDGSSDSGDLHTACSGIACKPSPRARLLTELFTTSTH